MYLLPIVYIVFGAFFFVGSIFLFLIDYKYVFMNQIGKRYLILNGTLIILSLMSLVFGVVYFFMVKSQL